MAASKSRTKKIIIRIGIAILAFILLFFIIVAILLNTIATPKRITPILLNMAHEYVDANIECESIDITFFGTFPDLGVKMSNGSIVHSLTNRDSLWKPSAQDTLLAFKSATVSVNPVAFLFDKKVIVHKLEIEDADIYAYVDTAGKANWDIMAADTTAVEPQDSTTAFTLPELNIKDIRLKNVSVTYDDLYDDTFVLMDSIGMRLNGNMSKQHANLNLAFRTSGITSYYQGQTYTKELPFSIRTRLNRDRVKKTLEIDRAAINVGILQLRAGGLIERADTIGMATTDLEFTLNASSLSDIVEMIPGHISEISNRLVAYGDVKSSGKISGLIGRGNYPTFSLAARLTDGAIASKKNRNKPFVEKINIDFETFIDLSQEKNSTFSLNEFTATTASSQLTVSGQFGQLLTNPSIDARAKANINFTQISRFFALPEDMKMGGLIDFDMSAKCLLNDVLNANLGKINVDGNANIKNLVFDYVTENLSVYASKADMKFGSNTTDSIRGRVRESLLRGNLSLDSLNINWKDELKATAGKVSARFSTSEAKDTGAIAPVVTNARMQNFRLNMGDSVRVRAFQTSAFIRMSPSATNSSLPQINMRFSLDTLVGRYTTTGGAVRNANLSLKLNRTQPRNSARFIRQGSDSTRVSRRNTTGIRQRYAAMTREQRDSMRNAYLNPEGSLSFRLESKETRDLLRKWDVSGSFNSKSIHLRTPLFPLPMKVKEGEMDFTTNNLKINKADMLVGASSFNLKGDIEGIRRALLMNGKVSAKLILTGDSIDFNQLIKAAVAGSEYASKSVAEKDSISERVLDETQEIPIDVDTISSGIFVVPRNLDIEFNSRIRNAKFSDIWINNAVGRIILKDQAIQLSRFRLNSDIGKANMTMVYKAADSRGAHVGLDMGITQMDVKELINAFPMLDDLAPMLRSFEGVVDCDITAVSELDSVMNVVLPQTTASCLLRGANMVLLDGETFSEISKTLRFKNKKRNLIDSISIEMILEDEKLMIFPFRIALDRYDVAVGGVQNLDLSFNYHITVLKSPLPFKLGLNITGNMDDMKIRLAKAKYKDLFTVAREKKLTGTVNVREEMGDKLRKSISEIVGSDVRQPIRRPRSSLPDSLKTNYFRLDTTAEDVSLPDSVITE